MSPEDLTFYNNASVDEREALKNHLQIVALYTSICSGTTLATCGVLYSAKTQVEPCVALLITGIGMVLCLIGLTATERQYRHYLIAVTVRAKIEAKLGLNQIGYVPADAAYWQSEPLVFKTFLDRRLDSASSVEFVRRHRLRMFPATAYGVFLLYMLFLAGLGVRTVSIAGRPQPDELSAGGEKNGAQAYPEHTRRRRPWRGRAGPGRR